MYKGVCHTHTLYAMMDSSGALPPFGRGIVCNTNLYRVWRLGIHLIYLLISFDLSWFHLYILQSDFRSWAGSLPGSPWRTIQMRPCWRRRTTDGTNLCIWGFALSTRVNFLTIYIIIYNIYIYIYERHKIMQNMMLHDITDIPVTGFLFHSNGRGVSSCSWQYLQDSAKGELQVCRLYPCFPSSFSFMMGKQSLPRCTLLLQRKNKSWTTVKCHSLSSWLL